MLDYMHYLPRVEQLNELVAAEIMADNVVLWEVDGTEIEEGTLAGGIPAGHDAGAIQVAKILTTFASKHGFRVIFQHKGNSKIHYEEGHPDKPDIVGRMEDDVGDFWNVALTAGVCEYKPKRFPTRKRGRSGSTEGHSAESAEGDAAETTEGDATEIPEDRRKLDKESLVSDEGVLQTFRYLKVNAYYQPQKYEAHGILAYSSGYRICSQYLEGRSITPFTPWRNVAPLRWFMQRITSCPGDTRLRPVRGVHQKQSKIVFNFEDGKNPLLHILPATYPTSKVWDDGPQVLRWPCN